MRDLPDFADPPLVEVAIGVQFDPLTTLRSAHLGVWWGSFRHDFPRVEEQPPLPPMAERFGVETAVLWRPQFSISTDVVVNRTWFLNESGSELIQVQADRCHHNWRKVKPDQPYPRYDAIVGSFEAELRSFESFVQQEAIGPALRFNQCELVYVNLMTSGVGAPEEWRGHSDPAAVLAELSRTPHWGTIEDVTMRIRQHIPGESGQPIGRLTAEFEPVFLSEDKREGYKLQLTARGEPLGKGLAGVRRFLDVGHRLIVRGFTDLTTPEMHKIWGRSQ